MPPTYVVKTKGVKNDMRRILILLNHQLTDIQVSELRGKGFEPEYMTVEEKQSGLKSNPKV